MDRVELIYRTVTFAKLVDCHPLLPFKCDGFRAVIREWEHVLEDPYTWSSEACDELDDCYHLPDRDLLLAQIDVAGGGWHRS